MSQTDEIENYQDYLVSIQKLVYEKTFLDC